MHSSAWDVGGAVHVCVTACGLAASACEGVTLVDATRTRRGGLLTSFPSMYDAYGTQKPLECAADVYQGRVDCGATGHMVCCAVLTVPVPGKDVPTACTLCMRSFGVAVIRALWRRSMLPTYTWAGSCSDADTVRIVCLPRLSSAYHACYRHCKPSVNTRHARPVSEIHLLG